MHNEFLSDYYFVPPYPIYNQKFCNNAQARMLHMRFPRQLPRIDEYSLYGSPVSPLPEIEEYFLGFV